MTVSEFKIGYKHYVDLIKREKKLKDEVEDLWYYLSGVKGITYDRIPSSFNAVKIAEDRLDLLDTIEQKVKEIRLIEAQYEYFTLILAKFTEEERAILYRIIIKGQSYETLGEEYGYTGAGMFKYLERIINKIINC